MENMVIEGELAVFRDKKVLITGHTGFKGSWLSLWLHKIGSRVIGIGLDPKTERDNFYVSRVGDLIKDYRLDIRDRESLFKVVESERPDIVFHMAAQPLVLESYENPLDTFDTNFTGTLNVLEAIRRSSSISTAIFITTDKVYDNKEWFWPYRESEELGGFDPYSASKGASEILISCYRNSFFSSESQENNSKFKSIASVRAGNVIGGGDWAENRLIPDCIRSLEEGEKIKIRNPSSTRPWQHVLEPLGGYLQLAVKMIQEPRRFNEAFNFGPHSQNIMDVRSLTDAIIKHYGSGEWEDISLKNAPHEAHFLSLDINKAKNVLSWKPVLSFDETIELTTEWYRGYNKEMGSELCNKQISNYCKLWNLRKEN